MGRGMPGMGGFVVKGLPKMWGKRRGKGVGISRVLQTCSYSVSRKTRNAGCCKTLRWAQGTEVQDMAVAGVGDSGHWVFMYLLVTTIASRETHAGSLPVVEVSTDSAASLQCDDAACCGLDGSGPFRVIVSHRVGASFTTHVVLPAGWIRVDSSAAVPVTVVSAGGEGGGGTSTLLAALGTRLGVPGSRFPTGHSTQPETQGVWVSGRSPSGVMLLDCQGHWYGHAGGHAEELLMEYVAPVTDLHLEVFINKFSRTAVESLIRLASHLLTLPRSRDGNGSKPGLVVVLVTNAWIMCGGSGSGTFPCDVTQLFEESLTSAGLGARGMVECAFRGVEVVVMPKVREGRCGRGCDFWSDTT
jgi:hypothetical protein